MSRKKKIEDETKKKVEEVDEIEEKPSASLSEEALEAFDDKTPTGLEEEETLEDEEDDEFGEMNFRTSDEW